MGLRKEIKYLLIQKLLTSPAYHFLNLHAKTIKLTVEGDRAFLDHLERGGRILFASWHQRFFGGFYFPRLYDLEPAIMISQSRDGDFIAAVVRRIGWIPVRGSSSRGGRQALQEMMKSLDKDRSVGAHIVDGPTGPPRVIKPGLLSLARKVGAAICPGYVTYENPWIFRSWDRFMIPKPFSRAMIRFGGLTMVPDELTGEEFESLRRRIEEDMIKGYEEADRSWAGRGPRGKR